MPNSRLLANVPVPIVKLAKYIWVPAWFDTVPIVKLAKYTWVPAWFDTVPIVKLAKYTWVPAWFLVTVYFFLPSRKAMLH